MPTNEPASEFFRDYAHLSAAQRAQFKRAVKEFVADLKTKRPFRAGLRVKSVVDHPNIFEITWDKANGRATFMYGSERIPGEAHIIWRRIGGHEIFDRP